MICCKFNLNRHDLLTVYDSDEAIYYNFWQQFRSSYDNKWFLMVCSQSLPAYKNYCKMIEKNVMAGNMVAVKQWYDYGGYQDYKKIISLLRTACQHGHSNIVDILLTPDVVTYLVRNNPITTSSWVNIYLNLGCFYGHLGVVKCLVSRIGKERLNMKYGLEIASSSRFCVDENNGLLNYLMDETKCAEEDKEQWYMALAATKGDIKIVNDIMKKVSGKTFFKDAINRSFRYASVNGHTDVVSALLEDNKADINNIGFTHFFIGRSTALAAACARGQFKTTKELLNNELCKVGEVTQCHRGETPFNLVIWCDQKNWTELHQVASDGREDSIGKIVRDYSLKGGDYCYKMINWLDNSGRTPLHIAFLGGHTKVVKALLSFFAETGIRNDDRESLAGIAKTWGRDELISILKFHDGTED